MKAKNHIVLQVKDKPFFKSIDAICEALGVDPKTVRRGYMRASGASLPSDPTVFLWWPAESHGKWENELSPDGKTFSSKSRTEPFSFSALEASASVTHRSAVFFRRDSRPYGYRFVGVFETNLEKSRECLRHVFDLVSEKLEV